MQITRLTDEPIEQITRFAADVLYSITIAGVPLPVALV